jgi:hypothetical protein
MDLIVYVYLSIYLLYLAKFNATDTEKVLSCAKHYEKHIDFDLILQ